jgi:acyl-homoserine-lactone acylase
MQKPVAALSQSYLRTKAVDYATFRRVAELRANSSNNTIFADAKGEIAYLHPQFIPRRDDRFDYTQTVDGSDPQTDWHGLHALDEAPHLLDPPNGWIANSNNWPYSAAGPNSPKIENYPRYMDTVGENARGVHDTLLLTGRMDFTLDGLIAAAYDSYLPAFADLVPKLLSAYDALPGTDARKAKVAEPIAMLRNWDDRWSAISIPTALAVFFGEALGNSVDTHVPGSRAKIYDAMRAATPDQLVSALVTGTDKLSADFGTWRTPWGEINRFQRIDDAIAQRFDDAAPSIPVPFTSSLWGSLASFGTSASRTKKHYGTSGNSFVAVVEFGPKIRAKAITAGGESGNPKSPHFTDEALRYSAGELRDVYFYPEQLVGHTERSYHP